MIETKTCCKSEIYDPGAGNLAMTLKLNGKSMLESWNLYF